MVRIHLPPAVSQDATGARRRGTRASFPDFSRSIASPRVRMSTYHGIDPVCRDHRLAVAVVKAHRVKQRPVRGLKVGSRSI
jgi:hypothetical protein